METEGATQPEGAEACPCQSGATYDDCCGPVIAGEAQAKTAEALMRARYTAYTQGEIDFVVASHDPDTAEEVDREASENWSKEAEWLGLDIVRTSEGGEGDERGEVEFIARYRMGGGDLAHHEVATFRRREDGWHYLDGDMVKAKPVVREGPKVGRNEPCPCGSGKKFKKCCA